MLAGGPERTERPGRPSWAPGGAVIGPSQQRSSPLGETSDPRWAGPAPPHFAPVLRGFGPALPSPALQPSPKVCWWGAGGFRGARAPFVARGPLSLGTRAPRGHRRQLGRPACWAEGQASARPPLLLRPREETWLPAWWRWLHEGSHSICRLRWWLRLYASSPSGRQPRGVRPESSQSKRQRAEAVPPPTFPGCVQLQGHKEPISTRVSPATARPLHACRGGLVLSGRPSESFTPGRVSRTPQGVEGSLLQWLSGGRGH